MLNQKERERKRESEDISFERAKSDPKQKNEESKTYEAQFNEKTTDLALVRFFIGSI